jgi:plasmid stabilization system protein ParE
VKPVWTQRALSDLRAQCDYIARENPAAAIDVEARVIDAVGRLKGYVDSGRPGRVQGTRELPVHRTSLLVVYVTDPDAVRIMHVRHTARRPADRL